VKIDLLLWDHAKAGERLYAATERLAAARVELALAEQAYTIAEAEERRLGLVVTHALAPLEQEQEEAF
jgi:hypothetical protein